MVLGFFSNRSLFLGFLLFVSVLYFRYCWVMEKDNTSRELKGSQAAITHDNIVKRSSNNDGGINTDSSLLGNAPILKSVLRRAARNVPGKTTNPSQLNVDVECSTIDGDKGNTDSTNYTQDAGLSGNIANKAVSVDANLVGNDGNEATKGTLVDEATNDATNGELSQAGPTTSVSTSKQQPNVNGGYGSGKDVGKSSNEVCSQNKPKLSYASMFKTKNAFKSVNICELRNEERVEGAHVAIPMKEIEDVSARFANTLYGYFIGKRLAFPIVENYVKNTWAKFGLERVMLNNGFFLFQFATKEGMDQVLETGPWLIRSIPIFLNIWTPNTTLAKEQITSAPVWLKLHNVPIVAYTEVGLSLITTQIGKPIMLDSYTSTMCVKSWGQNSYARALVEVSSLNTLMDHVVVAIPFSNGSGHSLVRIDIEYEWKPPCCSVCKIFDHNDVACPKNVKQTKVQPNIDEEGFVAASKRKGKGKAPMQDKVIDGVRFTKPKVQFSYRWQPVSKPKGGSDGASSSKGNGTSNESNAPKELGDKSASSHMTYGTDKETIRPNVAAGLDTLENQPPSNVHVHSKYIHDDLSDIATKNPFSALGDGVILGLAEDFLQADQGVHVVDSESDNEVDEHIEFGKQSTDTSDFKEASTSSVEVPHV